MSDELDAPVVAFLTDAGVTATRADGGALVLTSGEVSLVVRQDVDWSVEVVERGHSDGIYLTTPDRDVVERYVVRWAGGIRGFRLGWPLLSAWQMELPAHVTLVQDAHGRFSVHHDDRPVASGMLDVQAKGLAVLVAHPVQDVVTAYRDHAGRPVFSGDAEV